MKGSWKKRLWIIAVAGISLALAPLIIALFGLLMESSYLQAYHWYLYFSVPVGLPIALLAGLAALVIKLRGAKKND